jgi:hypothetical protein
MGGASAMWGRGEDNIAPRGVSKAEEGCPVTLAMTAEYRAQLYWGRASDDVTLSEQDIQGSATACSKPNVE